MLSGLSPASGALCNPAWPQPRRPQPRRHKLRLQGLAGKKPREPPITSLTKPRPRQKPAADKRSLRLGREVWGGPPHTYLPPSPPLPCRFTPVLPRDPFLHGLLHWDASSESHPDLGCFFKAFVGSSRAQAVTPSH